MSDFSVILLLQICSNAISCATASKLTTNVADRMANFTDDHKSKITNWTRFFFSLGTKRRAVPLRLLSLLYTVSQKPSQFFYRFSILSLLW